MSIKQNTNKENITEKYVDELSKQLNTFKNDVENNILSPENIKRIKNKILGKKMTAGEWIKGNLSMLWLNVFKINKFKIGNKEYDSIFDFIKELHEKIAKAETEDELLNLWKEIDDDGSNNNGGNNNDGKADDTKKNRSIVNKGKEKYDNNLDFKTPSDAIVFAVNEAIKKKVTGKNCGDWVKKIFENSGFDYSDTNQVIRAYQGKPYTQKPRSKDTNLNGNINYQENKNIYQKLLNSVQIGDHIIFHNNNKYDPYGNHSGIFMGRDQNKGGKPFAKLASLPGNGKKPRISTYNLGRGKITKHNIPKGQICAIRRCQGTVVQKNIIANNLGKLPKVA